MSGGILLDIEWQPYGQYDPPQEGSFYIIQGEDAVYGSSPSDPTVIVSSQDQ